MPCASWEPAIRPTYRQTPSLTKHTHLFTAWVCFHSLQPILEKLLFAEAAGHKQTCPEWHHLSLGFLPVPQAAESGAARLEIISTADTGGLLTDKTSPWYLQVEDKLLSLAYLRLPLQCKQFRLNCQRHKMHLLSLRSSP